MRLAGWLCRAVCSKRLRLRRRAACPPRCPRDQAARTGGDGGQCGTPSPEFAHVHGHYSKPPFSKSLITLSKN